MSWQPKTNLPKRRWLKPVYKEKRAITLAEHERIIAAEVNLEQKWEALYDVFVSGPPPPAASF